MRERIQSFAARFPTQRSREFLYIQQGIFRHEQGNFSPDTRRFARFAIDPLTRSTSVFLTARQLGGGISYFVPEWHLTWFAPASMAWRFQWGPARSRQSIAWPSDVQSSRAPGPFNVRLAASRFRGAVAPAPSARYHENSNSTKRSPSW